VLCVSVSTFTFAAPVYVRYSPEFQDFSVVNNSGNLTNPVKTVVQTENILKKKKKKFAGSEISSTFVPSVPAKPLHNAQISGPFYLKSL
jgi:hypothetical protein